MESLVKNDRKLFFYTLIGINCILFIYFLVTNNYLLPLIVINILSILALWVWISFSAYKSFKHAKILVDLVIILSLFLFACTVYLYKIDQITPGIQGDEMAIAHASEQVLASGQAFPFANINLGHPTPLLYLTGVSIEMFGRSLMAIRLPYLLFGALSVSAFYLLLRLFFSKSIATTVSVLFLFSYPVIILSRLAYEIMPSLFFQILSALFLYLAWKKKDIRYFAAVGLLVGAGFYTYLGFRSFALVVIVLSAFIICRAKSSFKEKKQQIFVFLITLFISVTPLFSYSITHASELMTRTNSVAIFTYHLPASEFMKEFGGNIARLSYLFFFDGDPNIRNNPSGVHMFDIGTFFLFLVGLYFLFKKDKILFSLLLIFSLSPLLNDIFTLERITDFHYYGQGHPNTLRIAGIIPIIYFGVAYGIAMVHKRLASIGSELVFTCLWIIVTIICVFNLYSYFNQPFSGYVYNFNGGIVMNVVQTLNKSTIKEVAVSPFFLRDDKFNYFIRKDIVVKPFAPKNYTEAIKDLNANTVTIIDPSFNKQLYMQIVQYTQAKVNFQIQPIVSPIKSLDAVALINGGN